MKENDNSGNKGSRFYLVTCVIQQKYLGMITLGNPEEHTIIEIVLLIKKLTKSHSRIVHLPHPHDDPKRRKPDITKANQILHREPKVSLEEGLEKTIADFQERLK